MGSVLQSSPESESLTLRELSAALSEHRRAITVATGVATVIGCFMAWLLPPMYSATVLISPVSSTSGASQLGAAGSVVGQLGGLAALAGISGGADAKKSESLAVLQSEALTESYIQQNNLLPILFPKKWDATKSAWKTTSADAIPTLWKANEYFKRKVRAVTTDSKSGLVSFTIVWRDPGTAATWANDLVKKTNEYLRNRAIQESERNIAYLNEQASKTSVVEAKQAIYSLLQAEINKVMIARGNEEYAFRVLDPAVPPEKPSTISMPYMILASSAGGLLLSILIVFVRVAWRP